MAKILIAGASGFLGSHLRRALKLSGHEIVALDRVSEVMENVDRVAKWDGRTADAWVEELETSDVLINLSGKNIACKWTEANKLALRESRIGTTQLLAEACALVSVPPKLWINMSGINAYRQNLDEPLDESGPVGTGFLSELVQDWEAAFFLPDLPETRRIALRAAPVMGRGGGAFDIYVKLAKWFIGGPAGSGRQWMSWTHIQDLVRMFEWLIGRHAGSGPYNACAPEPVRNAAFMAALRRAYGRPWAPPAPGFAIRLLGLLGGPDPSLALDGFRVVPARALEEGFEFRFPTVEAAFGDLAT